MYTRSEKEPINEGKLFNSPAMETIMRMRSQMVQFEGITKLRICLDYGIPYKILRIDEATQQVFLPPPEFFNRNSKKMFWIENEYAGEHYFFYSETALSLQAQLAFKAALFLTFVEPNQTFEEVCEQYGIEFLGGNAMNQVTLPTEVIAALVAIE
jgi:hypothetical protein